MTTVVTKIAPLTYCIRLIFIRQGCSGYSCKLINQCTLAICPGSVLCMLPLTASSQLMIRAKLTVAESTIISYSDRVLRYRLGSY